MKSLNVIKTGLAASACLSLLAACQGQGAFHSKMFTPAEAAHFKQVWNEQHPSKPASDDPTKAPEAPDKNPSGGDKGDQKGGQTGGAPGNGAPTGGAPNSGPVFSGTGQPGAPAGSTPTNPPGGEASAKVITENVTADTLKAQDDLDLRTNVIDPDAVTIVNAIDIPVKGTGPDQLSIGVDALVSLDTAQRFLFVQDTPVAFKQDGSVVTLPISLQESRQSANLLGAGDDLVVGRAFCTDVTCTEIQIRFEFRLKDKTVPVVFQLRWDSSASKFQLHSNIGDHPKSFQDLVKDADQPAQPTPPHTPTPPSAYPAQPAQTTPVTPVTPATPPHTPTPPSAYPAQPAQTTPVTPATPPHTPTPPSAYPAQSTQTTQVTAPTPPHTPTPASAYSTSAQPSTSAVVPTNATQVVPNSDPQAQPKPVQSSSDLSVQDVEQAGGIP